MSTDDTDERTTNERTTDEQTERTHDGTEQDHGQDDRKLVGASRRTVLQGVAAGSVVGLGGLAVGQDGGTTTTTQQGGQDQTFFDEGATVGTKKIADGPLTAPTDFAVAHGQNNEYVADQTGEVYAMTGDGLRDEPFIDISDRMVEIGQFYGLYADAQQSYDERGLLGIEFHPNFQQNRKFYLHYSAPPTETLRDISWDHIEVVSEFQATEDLSSGDPESERKLLTIPSPQYNHDSGPIAFGPDGYLYVPMGDGGGANDMMYGHVPDWYETNLGGNGQDIVHNLMGDVLRIDVDSQGENKPYGIPDDNPFAGEAPGRDEIYAYGFRNPFGISFDSEGNMFVADAGQNLWEEVDLVEKGGNYGWNVKEGTHCFSTEFPSRPPAITECPSNAPEQNYGGAPLQGPIAEFPHEYNGEFVGITVIGGHRYEQSTIPDLQDKYVFGAWTEDPTRQEPAGRILTAEPPQNFGQGDQTDTAGNQTAGNQTAGNQTEGNQSAAQMAALQDETDNQTANQTNTTTVEPAETENVEKAPAEEGTPGDVTTTPTGEQDIPPEGPGVVPRDQLWTMRELVIEGEFSWFVRQFGRSPEGEIYVLVSQRGVPEGDTGAVLKLVPPGEGDAAAGAETGNQTAGNETAGNQSVDTDETTTAAQDR